MTIDKENFNHRHATWYNDVSKDIVQKWWSIYYLWYWITRVTRVRWKWYRDYFFVTWIYKEWLFCTINWSKIKIPYSRIVEIEINSDREL